MRVLRVTDFRYCDDCEERHYIMPARATKASLLAGYREWLEAKKQDGNRPESFMRFCDVTLETYNPDAHIDEHADAEPIAKEFEPEYQPDNSPFGLLVRSAFGGSDLTKNLNTGPPMLDLLEK